MRNPTPIPMFTIVQTSMSNLDLRNAGSTAEWIGGDRQCTRSCAGKI